MRYLRVKNWSEFQHYRDRLPPWIKLHRALLDDYEFTRLPDESKAHLVLIWLLASHHDGRVPEDPKWIAEKIGAKRRVDLAILLQSGWLIPEQPTEQNASTALASSKQDASASLSSRAPARSRETEAYKAETEAEKKTPAALPPWLPASAWKDWCDYRASRKGWTQKAQALCLRELAKLHAAGNDPTAVIERSIMGGWSGLFPLKGEPGSRDPSRSERRARNMDILTGKVRDERAVEGVAERVGGAVVLPLSGDLREPIGDDVGERGPGRSAAGMG